MIQVKASRPNRAVHELANNDLGIVHNHRHYNARSGWVYHILLDRSHDHYLRNLSVSASEATASDFASANENPLQGGRRGGDAHDGSCSKCQIGFYLSASTDASQEVVMQTTCRLWCGVGNMQLCLARVREIFFFTVGTVLLGIIILSLGRCRKFLHFAGIILLVERLPSISLGSPLLYSIYIVEFPGEYTPSVAALVLAVIGGPSVGCVPLRKIHNSTCAMKQLYV